MTRSAEILLAALIDFAGTFPPATLGLADAAAEYARQRSGASRRMLGRFVLAATDLDAFEALTATILTSAATPWDLAIVGKREAIPDVARLERFNRAMTGRATIGAIEFAPMPASEIGASARLADDIDMFFEVPVSGDIEASLAAIAASGGCAKIRTGGVTAATFPDPMAVVAFMHACHNARVPFKATAGLHHAVCGSYPLTYQPDSARATMFGFLNVSVAAALIYAGGDDTDAADALRETSANALAFSDGGLVWRGRYFAVEHLAATRRSFFKSFGSCAFQEPVEELAQLGIIEDVERSAGSGTSRSHD